MKEPTALIYDRGGFFPFAQALTTGMRVLYFSEWREVAPSVKSAYIGRDVPGIERVDSFYDHLPDADVIVFPDIGDGDFQHWLREKGYPVWGTDRAEMLELDRHAFKGLMEKIGEPVINAEHIIGVDDLEAYLREHEDVYVKSSFFRGDLETFHHVTWDLSEPWFDDLVSRLGPHGLEAEFLVEDPVAGCEVGYDAYCIDGEFPLRAAWGVELKDAAYIGTWAEATKLPLVLQHLNDVMSGPLKTLGCRGNYSNEVRIAEDGTAYLNDPTCRCPSPPISLLSVWIQNWPDIVMGGAHGECVAPEFSAQYGVEIELRSDWLTEHWLALDIPAETMPWVRVRRPAVVDGRYWCVPHDWLDICGSAIGLGPTPEAAIDAALDVADQIKGYQVEYNHHCKDELLDAWQQAQEVTHGG